jgi:hypothetical protein
VKLEVKINSTGFRAMTQEIARLSGKDYATVLRLEAAYCIKRAALESKVASLTQIRRAIEERDSSRLVRTEDGRVLMGRDSKGEGHAQMISTNTVRDAGRVWYIDATLPPPPPRKNWVTRKRWVNGGRAYMVFDAGPSRGVHLPAEIWAQYNDLSDRFSAAKKALYNDLRTRRGLERQSWLQMADDMQVDLGIVAPAGPIKSEEARDSNFKGIRFRNGLAFDQTVGAKFTITVTNKSPIAQKRKGQSRLDSAIASRVDGFKYAMKRGFLNDLTYRARRWPGIFVKPA